MKKIIYVLPLFLLCALVLNIKNAHASSYAWNWNTYQDSYRNYNYYYNDSGGRNIVFGMNRYESREYQPYTDRFYNNSINYYDYRKINDRGGSNIYW